MKTLFDINENKPVGQFRPTPYTVNGKPGQLPDNVVELDVVYADYPTGDIVVEDQGWEADLEQSKYRQYYKFRKMTEQEIALREWGHTDFVLRIIAPIELTLKFPQFEVWFRLNDLPVIRRDKQILLYCNEILEEHQQVFDELKDVIKIEKRP